MASTGSTATSGGTTAASTGSGGASGCIEITAKGFIELDNDGNRADYGTPFKLNLGAPETDRLELTFWGSGVDGSLNGEATGTFDLSTGGDADINSCSRCLGAQEDASSPGRYFFQKSGTIAIDATSDQMNGTLKATLTDVTLVEFDLDAGSVVPNGACLHLASATIAAVPLVAPAAWVCDSHFFADNACDCGCGAPDPDCDDTTLASCDWCSDIGSCNFGGCPGAIDPANNATCTP